MIRRKNCFGNKGFTMIELLVSVAILAIILLAIALFVFWMNFSKIRTDANSRVLENARRAMDLIAFEIKRASPTSSVRAIAVYGAYFCAVRCDKSRVDSSFGVIFFMLFVRLIC